MVNVQTNVWFAWAQIDWTSREKKKRLKVVKIRIRQICCYEVRDAYRNDENIVGQNGTALV